MQELFQKLLGQRERCSIIARDLIGQFHCAVEDHPIGAFGMCFNTATFAAETCSHFIDAWKKIDARGISATSQQKEEARQRVVMFTKVLLVFGISALEHSAKVATERYPAAVPLDKTKKWQYLSNIIGKSHALGLVSADAKAKWDAIIKLRNTIVHNNGFASEDVDMIFPNGAVIALRAGKMAEGDLLLFVRLMDWAIDSYAEWAALFMTRAGLSRA